MTTLTLNKELNGIEIKFDCKPISETLEALHNNGFKWHRHKKLWYAKNTANRLKFAESLAEHTDTQQTLTPKKQKATESLNILGVKVGDLFYTSWGYEQTNVNFFQVIALKGRTSCLLREVYPEIEQDKTASNVMAADRKYKLTSEILPPAAHSSFINDNEDGDLRRIKEDWNGNPCIKVGRPGCYQDTAYKYNGEELYESWYY